MRKSCWSAGAGIQLQHLLLIGDLTMGEIAKFFNVERSNLYRVVKSMGLITKPFPHHFTSKQRHIGLQLVKMGEDLPEVPDTPHKCRKCGHRLTYNIYREENHNATAYVGCNTYCVCCKECDNDSVY